VSNANPPVPLKNGNFTYDRRLDRIPQVDPRSDEFPMRRLLSHPVPPKPRSYTWSVGEGAVAAYPTTQLVLDQGQEGACVGFSFAHEYAAKPQIVKDVDKWTAHSIYRWAQDNDEWPGSDYSGTSVLAGAKAGVDRGVYKSYAWSHSAAELAVVVSRKGPVVLGIDWYRGMYDTMNGYIEVAGDIVGGHAILCRGYSTNRHAFLLHNSWGWDWGVNGTAWLRESDLQILLNQGGEACLPLRTKYTDAVVW
jgi:hypothetical protein